MAVEYAQHSRSAKKALGVAVVAALALALAANNATALNAQSVNISQPDSRISVAVGRGKLITLPSPIEDIFIAENNIADVQVRSPRQIYIFGKKGGQTSFYATSASGKVIYSAEVSVGAEISSIDQMLSLAMPDASIAVSTTNNFVLLTGTIANPDDAEEAENLVQAFVGGETRVVSRLKTATPMQVNLKVRFAEVSRSLAKEINGNILTRDTTGGFQFGVSRGRNFGSITAATANLPQLDASQLFGLPAGSVSLPFDPVSGQFVTASGTAFNYAGASGLNTIQAAGRLFGLDIATALDVSERVGLVSTLASPNLTTISGETATFLAGGEFPIPVSTGLGEVTVQYKNFGVSLSYTPTVLSNGRISIRVAPEVSEITSNGAVVLNGFSIPAVSTRRAETTVELGSGESFMIAGLMQNSYNSAIDKTPGLADVPILGTLFKSDGYRRNETELMIVVTPYLVKPVSDSEIVLPTDGFKAANDAERFLLNRNHSGSGGDRPKPSVAPTPPATQSFGSLETQAPAKSVKKSNKPGGTAPGFSFDK
ncbi:MAG: type II and III secretion system protein family protein [Sphingomonadales bacterium]|nr:type II and III secretion system protein family protein [Sphingomonadales bacterium]NCO47768.1 type II and III secretion system protein family protein [Sphingomonadales bacterium]NCO99687.1 type II and III secretion system protein family protein [Sphingomonadales bacterium]NCP27527.1 type II and III secretion system protein family protein [Sphingomonadales bacterium]NCP43348.1 type II and III secretion system protein family protein [Sphingomonadales bacterium]